MGFALLILLGKIPNYVTSSKRALAVDNIFVPAGRLLTRHVSLLLAELSKVRIAGCQ